MKKGLRKPEILLDSNLSIVYQMENNSGWAVDLTVLRDISDYLYQQWNLFWYSDQFGQNSDLTPRCSKIIDTHQIWHLIAHQVWFIKKYYLVNPIKLGTTLEQSLPFRLFLTFLQMNSEEKSRIYSWTNKIDPWYKTNRQSKDILEMIKCLILDDLDENWPGINIRIWIISVLNDLERSHLSWMILFEKCSKGNQLHTDLINMTNLTNLVNLVNEREYYHCLSSAWLREEWVKLISSEKSLPCHLQFLIQSDWIKPIESLIKSPNLPRKFFLDLLTLRIYQLVQFPKYQKRLLEKYTDLLKHLPNFTLIERQEMKEKLSLFFQPEELAILDLQIFPLWAIKLLDPPIEQEDKGGDNPEINNDNSRKQNDGLIHLAYLLNLPINGSSYSDDFLKERLKTLKIDRSIQAKTYYKQNELYWKSWADQLQIIQANDRNLSSEKIHKFPVGEIVYLISDRHVYFFTRSDLPWIFKENKNPWNRNPLNDWQINWLKDFQKKHPIPEYNLTIRSLYIHLDRSGKASLC